MATIRKTSSGKFKAVICARDGAYLKSKTFARKGDAVAWARRIEADREHVEALGTEGARRTLNELSNLYLLDWSGRDKGRGGRVAWWCAKFGTRCLIDLSATEIRDALDQYSDGYATRYDGIGKDLRPKLKATNRRRAPASVNRLKATLSALFQFAIRKGWAVSNPVRGIPQQTENNRRVRWLSDKEREALLEATRASRWERLHLLVLIALVDCNA